MISLSLLTFVVGIEKTRGLFNMCWAEGLLESSVWLWHSIVFLLISMCLSLRAWVVSLLLLRATHLNLKTVHSLLHTYFYCILRYILIIKANLCEIGQHLPRILHWERIVAIACEQLVIDFAAIWSSLGLKSGHSLTSKA